MKARKKAKSKPKSKLVGFARLRVTDPDKLKAIARKAGQTAQKKHGKWIRWTKAEARAMARTGGKAVQKQYQKTGHPLQIAQLKREAAGKKIRAGLRKRKARAKPVIEEPLLPLEPEPEQGPDKDVVNG
jgi:hypothetical protein